MIFSKSEELEDKIIEQLTQGNATIKSLHGNFASGEKLSLRAVYKAVNKLMTAGVLLKVGKRVMFDEEWVRRVGEGLRASPIAAPSTGEKVTYHFASMEHLDAFWKAIVLPIEDAAPSREIFFYNPHNFWAYLPERRESEHSYYRHFAKTGRHAFFTVGGDFEADRGFKREYQNEFMQVDARDIGSFPRRDHITVIGPFVVTVRLSKALASRIDELYATNKPVEDLLPQLLALCSAPGKIRFSLEHNAHRADQIRKLMARNFYFKMS